MSERIELRVSPEEKTHWQAIATNLDASLLSAAIAGGFIGNTFGPYALRR